MALMNEQIRKAIELQMKRRNLNQGELAEQVDMTPVQISRLMTGTQGKVPKSWERMFDVLGLRLIVVDEQGQEVK